MRGIGRNNKGLSTMVATSMIIMITIIAGAVIAQFVIPFVNQNLTRSTECVKVAEQFDFDERLGFNCYEGEIPNVKTKVSIKSKNDQEAYALVDGFSLLLFSEAGSSQSVKVKNVGSDARISLLTGVSEGTDQTSNLVVIPGTGETRTYLYTTPSIYTKAEVYPILKNGRVCEKRTRSIQLNACVKS